MENRVAEKLKALDEAIGKHVRPDTFPLGIRMIKPGEPVPDGLKIPSQSMGEHWIVCQSIGVARRYGWPLAEHASFGQNCFDASIGSEFVCISYSMPMDAGFFKSS